MIPQHNIQRVAVQRVRSGQVTRHNDVLAVEEPLEIRLVHDAAGERAEQSLSITMRTPGDDFELAAGFLVGEGIVREVHDIQQMQYCVDREKEAQAYNVVSVQLGAGVRFDAARLLRHFYTTSSCGVCGKASLEALEIQGSPALPPGAPVVSAEVLRGLDAKLRTAQTVFDKTGGLHAAALFDVSGNLISLREDVGRHNAVDKLVGEQLMAGRLPLSGMLMMVSGRSSFEIMQKALMAGIPIVAAVGAPSSLAVDLARQFGMTLLGFVRGESFNIYAGAQRVRLHSS
jgi:FdhD protein